MNHVHFIFDTVRNPYRSVNLDFGSLLETYATRSGKRRTWIGMMHDRSISARKQLEGVLKNEVWEKHGGHGR